MQARLLAAIMAAFSAAVMGLVPVAAAPAHSTRTVQILGEERFSPDEFFTQTFRFTPRKIRVQTGALVTWNNHTTEVHSISVVNHDQLPRMVQQVTDCGACGPFFAAHFPAGPGSPPVLVLDDFKPATGQPTLDNPSDSLLIAPPGLGLPTSVSATVTAPAGTTLDYVCIFHPWMQASIQVIRADEADE